MEEKESSASGVAVSGEEAPDSYRVAPRNENSAQFSGPTMTVPASTASASPVAAAQPNTEVKKKRGRPRKYGPDGTAASALALSPMPISSSIPLTGEFSSAWKRGKARPVDSIKKSHKYEAYESSGPGTLVKTHFIQICFYFYFFEVLYFSIFRNIILLFEIVVVFDCETLLCYIRFNPSWV